MKKYIITEEERAEMIRLIQTRQWLKVQTALKNLDEYSVTAEFTELAEWLHNIYEEIAKEKGWATQEKTRVPFNELPRENQETMLVLAQKIIERFELA